MLYQIMEKILGCFILILEVPMGVHQRITLPTTKPTPQNKIYYGTNLKELPFYTSS